jgi:dTDP-glucose pyrophosphorylase
MKLPGDRYIGVILAAGKGTRMAPFTSRYPKPILPVYNKPLLRHQIETMASLGIRQVIIVIGHLGFEVVKSIGNGNDLGVNITYIDQGDTLGIAHALGRLENHITKPFLLFLGDIFFVTDDLREMFQRFEQEDLQAVLVSKIGESPEVIRKNFTVIEGPEGLIKRVIEKPRHINTTIKGCGLYLFGLQIFDAIRRTPRTALRDEYEITDSIQILIDDGGRVKHMPLVKLDINLTTPEDLLSCNMSALAKYGQPSLVGANCQIATGTIFDQCVVGSNVVINKPYRFKRCIIFEGTVVGDFQEATFENMIFTPDNQPAPLTMAA